MKKTLGDKILIVFGGPHPTFVPDIIKQDGVDIVCRGEGEYAILELMQLLSQGKDYTKIQSLIVKKDGQIYENEIRPLCDVDELPFLDREIYRDIDYIYKNKRQQVMLARGCPFDCTFCSSHAFRELYKGKGNYVRLRSIPKIIEELSMIKKRYNPSCFFFHDETFGLKKDYYQEFLNTYKRAINLPFSCLVRADLVTEDFIRLLKETGCYFASFGVESGNEKLRNTLLKKRVTNDNILNCAGFLNKYKIPFSTFNMVGLPKETLADVWSTVDLNARLGPRWAWFSVYQTLPKTELAQYAQNQGYLKDIDVDKADATFHESSIILKNNPKAKEIIRLKNTANIIIKVHFLRALVKRSVFILPWDGLYALIDKFLYFIFYYLRLTYKMGFMRAMRSAFFIIRHLKELK